MAGLRSIQLTFWGVDRRKLRELLSVRIRLTFRQFMRQPGQIIGIVVLGLLLGTLTVLLSGVTAFGYLRAPDPWPVQILGVVLSGLWLIWILLPIMAYRTNEGLDLGRLLIYPLRTQDLIATAILGTMLDFPTYLALPFFLAILVGWATSPLLILVLVAAVLGYLHMMMISQLVLTAGGGVLRSRRFRDLSIVVLSLVGSSCYFVNQGIRTLVESIGPEGLISFQPLIFLRWLPPAAAVAAVADAQVGAWIPALGWLLYSLGWLTLVIWLWWRVLHRVTTGVTVWEPKPKQDTGGQTAKAGARVHRTSPAVPALIWMHPATRQLFLKELKAMWRVPQRRIGIIQGMLMPLLLIVIFRFNPSGLVTTTARWIGLGLPALALFSAWTISLNMIGMEGRGLATLLLTPVPRRDILVGKGLAIWLVSVLALTLYAVILAFFVPDVSLVASWLTALGVVLTTVSVGMVASVYFPYPFDEERTSRQRSGGTCATGLGLILIVPIAMGVAGLPAMAGLLIGGLLGLFWLQILGAAIAVAYGAALFWVASTFAGRLLLPREAEVLEATQVKKL